MQEYQLMQQLAELCFNAVTDNVYSCCTNNREISETVKQFITTITHLQSQVTTSHSHRQRRRSTNSFTLMPLINAMQQTFNKKAVLSQGNRAMPPLFFSV